MPYARAPEEIVPGKPLFFATAMTLAGSAIGLLVGIMILLTMSDYLTRHWLTSRNLTHLLRSQGLLGL